MDKIKSVFRELEPAYVIKNYITSAIIVLITLFSIDFTDFAIMIAFLLILISALLFPFSAFVWDSITSIMMGNSIIYMPLPILVIWKGTKIIMLFYFAIFIAPLGIIYLLIKNKNTARY